MNNSGHQSLQMKPLKNSVPEKMPLKGEDAATGRDWIAGVENTELGHSHRFTVAFNIHINKCIDNGNEHCSWTYLYHLQLIHVHHTYNLSIRIMCLIILWTLCLLLIVVFYEQCTCFVAYFIPLNKYVFLHWSCFIDYVCLSSGVNYQLTQECFSCSILLQVRISSVYQISFVT